MGELPPRMQASLSAHRCSTVADCASTMPACADSTLSCIGGFCQYGRASGCLCYDDEVGYCALSSSASSDPSTPARGPSCQWGVRACRSGQWSDCSRRADCPSIVPFLVGGTVTNDRSAVGVLALPDNSICTGTLVSKRIVVAAAHCYSFTTTNVDASLGTFNMNRTDGTPLPAASVMQTWTYGSGIGTSDVAFAILSQCVTDVSPEVLDTARPANGTNVTEFGYGCQDKVTWCATGKKPYALDQKQEVSFTLGSGMDGCPGDSGGPLFDTTGLFAVLSGSSPCNNGTDTYGDVISHLADFAKLQSLYPCTYEERPATVIAGRLKPLQPPAVLKFDSGESSTVVDGPCAVSLVRLNYGARVTVRLTRKPDGTPNVLAFRPMGNNVVGGIVRFANGVLSLDGNGSKIWFDASSTVSVVTALQGQAGQQVLVFGSVIHAGGPDGTPNATYIAAQAWDATQGLF